MARTALRKPSRAYCVGGMRDRVKVQARVLTEPKHGSADFDESFEPCVERWASVETVSGKTFFDGVSQRDLEVTHHVGLRWEPRIDSEVWILLEDGTRLDVLNVENLDERGDFVRLVCSATGDKGRAASRA